eukprot:jgi/Hompol1/6107/HPOL_002224-RA
MPRGNDEEEDTITTPGAADMLGALQARLNTLVGRSSGYIQSLPGEVHRRIDALQNLQDKCVELDSQFQKEVAELEKKYLRLSQPIYDKRRKIIAGEVEPTDEEADREGKDDEDEEIPRAPVSESDPIKGIPSFWLTALHNLPETSHIIQDDDEEALSSLVDIKLDYLDTPGFKLTFVFKPNDFFTNTTLTKTYFLQESEDPSYGDVVYDHAEGTEIKWKEDKNLSVTIEIKKQRHKATNKTRTVKKTVPKATFFDFFNPPAAPGEEEEEDEEAFDELDRRIQMDYEIGEAIKDKLIPRAVDWFTGKALEYEDDDEDYDDDLD